MRARRSGSREEGQILVLFALSLVVIMAIGALLYSGAQALVLRRQLQDGGDAAALAAVNIMQTTAAGTCTAARVAPGGDLYEKAKASVKLNLGWTDAQVTARMTVSCPTDANYANVAVQVDLSGLGPGFFGNGNLNVATTSTAINGQLNGSNYSVALLDPSNPSWTGHGGRTGCASYTINGGVTVTYEGSIFVDSTCTLAVSSNGSVKAQNAAFSMTMLNSSQLLTGGEVSAGTVLKVSPTPLQNQRPLIGDPLFGLIEPCHATSASNCIGDLTTLPARNMDTNNGGQCNGMKVACVLSPGTYSGGILAANGNNPGTLLLRPGVYYIEGGGVQLKSAVAQIIAIPATTGSCNGTCTNTAAITRYCNPLKNGSFNNDNGSCSLTTAQVSTNWEADCPTPPTATTCGVLIYNAKSDSKSAWTTTSGSADAVQSGSQGVMLLRSYQPANDSLGDGTLFTRYQNLIVWQARSPLPSATAPQPVVSMTGQACVILSGTVYAPGGEVDFGGGSCGAGGGSDAQLTLQFICWDLTLGGNNNFYFAYRQGSFAKPFGYGLIK